MSFACRQRHTMFMSPTPPRLISCTVRYRARSLPASFTRRSLHSKSIFFRATRSTRYKNSLRSISSGNASISTQQNSVAASPPKGIDHLEAANKTLKYISRLQFDQNIADLLEIHHAILQPTEGSESRVRVSVQQLDNSSKSSSAYDLVTLLLDNPLSSDNELRDSINSREKSVRGRNYVCYEHPDSCIPGSSRTPLPSPFFTRFKESLILEESYSAKPPLRYLLADIPIFVTSSFSLSPQVTTQQSHSTHAILIMDGAFDSKSPSIEKLRNNVAKAYGFDPSRVFFVDFARAMRGSRMLASDPSSASAVQVYQEDLLASGFTALLQELNRAVSLGVRQLHDDRLKALMKYTLGCCEKILHGAKSEVLGVKANASILHESALEEKEKAIVEILGTDVSSSLSENDGQNKIASGVHKASAELKPAVDSLNFWRLPFAVDEVSSKIDSTVDRAFSREFENDLIYNTGKLSSLQSQLISRCDSLLASLPLTFHSSVLNNYLSQIKASPLLPITSSSSLPSKPHMASAPPPPALLTPIRSRLTQLSYATRTLHLSAQRALITSFLSSAVSASGGAILVAFETLDAAGGATFSALGALLGIRWAIGNWERARVSWWGAFKRVGEGLERDMRDSLEDVLQKQVCIVPEETCEGLKKLAERREQEIEEAQDMLENLSKNVLEISDDAQS